MFLRSFVLSALALLLLPIAVAQTPAPASDPAYTSDPRFQQAMKEGKFYAEHQRSGFAVDAYKKANKIAGGSCASCLMGIANAQMQFGSYKDALETVTKREAVAATPVDKAAAQIQHGQILLAQGGDKPKPAQLQAAHDLFQQVLAVFPRSAAAHFLDGQTLARLGKLEDAKSQFTTCLSCISPTDPMRLRAEHFAADPELSTHKMAPEFEVTALDGSKFNLDAMGGRVVLIDFWATWCGPCNEELPHIRQIAKDFAGQPLVIISVSWDADEAKWKSFIQHNGMNWVQYRDTDHKLSDTFGIHEIPHYFTIDSDGVLTAEVLGSGSDVEGKLKGW